ncbi:carotenoid oxygenase family protein [Fodinicola feengrottensis]|uniref:Dioxygenase n=2 Tax=Fodinicola feengrottensis TaxID=435914 RepID=A0ABN2J572_9ACTN
MLMTNHFARDNYAPIRTEQTLTELPVTGHLPAHLDGRYLRNGPNPLADIDEQAYHWFMGDGMVHGIRIRDGRAEWYRNRWVRTHQISEALGEKPGPVRPGAGLSGFGANTNVIAHAGKTLALIEGGVASYELTDELDTVGPCDFDGTLPGGYVAHPKRDPDTGELHAVSYFFGRGNKVQYSVIGLDGRARRTVDVEVTGSPMMHDFSLTEKYVIFYDLPVTFDARQAVAGAVPPFLRAPAQLFLSAVLGGMWVPDPVRAMLIERGGASNGRFPYRWNPKYPARVGVMPRHGDNSQVRWFEVGACFVFHPLNAYDDGDSVVLDVVRHPKMFATDFHGPNDGVPTLDRWTIDLAGGKLREERLDDHPQEFPRADERLLGRRHRYGYAMQVGHHGGAADSILKHDLVAGTTSVRSLGKNTQASEFVFIPNADDSAEDDGVLMGFRYDGGTDRSDLLLLDAGSLDEVAAIHLPDRVPHGFHGNWLPTEA